LLSCLRFQVKLWLTFNEPTIFIYYGYGCGLSAPAVKGLPVIMFTVAHNVIRAHARAWHTYDRHFRPTQAGCWRVLTMGGLPRFLTWSV